MDSLGSLNAFVRAAEAQSFTVAGRELGVSSSAIGKAVARMEDRLGVRLLQFSDPNVRDLHATAALEMEGLGDDTDSEDAHLTSYSGDDWGCACAGAPAHAGREEDHV